MKLDKPFTDGPDFDHFLKVLKRETTEGPVPLVELAVDAEIMSEVSGFDFPEGGLIRILKSGEEADPEFLQLGIKLMDLSLAFSDAVGYDYVTTFPIVPVRRTNYEFKENPQQEGKVRSWQNESRGQITNRDEFEAFPWPAVEAVSIISLEYMAGKLPPGRKLLVFIFGIFEDLKLLMGFENMAIASLEDPKLCDDILEKLTVLEERAVELSCAHPATGAIFYAEDMGFNTSTMLNPSWMREHVIHRHKRLADVAKKHGKPFMLHSCGQIDALMEDMIETVGIDARHAYQDNVEPVEEVYKKYGDRIAILGGLDVDTLARKTPDQVRARTRQILDACAPSGGFMMGTGNSVTNFCPVENYYAMVDEVRKFNEEH